MARVALLSNPRSTGNRSLLPRVRSFCAAHKDIFHYEVEDVDQIGTALATIARVKPKVLVINGGDGTVQAALTELYHGDHFKGGLPPVAVLPNGKTNLIALDLGAVGDPLEALARVLEIAKSDLESHVVQRELISLSEGNGNSRAVLGMFLGAAGLADTMLYCRHKIYPLGLPNGVSHAITMVATLISLASGLTGKLLPPMPAPVRVSVIRDGQLQGRFALLMVTTLEKLLLGSHTPQHGAGGMQLMAVERKAVPLMRALVAAVRGTLGLQRLRGVHIERGDEIKIEGLRTRVILDGELFQANEDHPIILKSSSPVPFLRLAA